MRFLIKPHQGKEQPYREALLAAGHVESADPEVVLIDFEVPVPKGDYAKWVGATKEKGAALVAYPHGFALVGEHQLTKKPYPCAAAFVHGPGHVWLRLAYHYPNPVHAIGYPGPRLTLEPRELKRVLFAPHHPLGSGWMPEDARQANTEAFRALLRDRDYDLSVRYVGTLEQNGIWEERGVRYIPGQMDGTTNDADVAVAGGTYAANCLARGIPVVMYNQQREWRVELEDHDSRMVPNWRDHLAFTHYPYDLDSESVLQEAAANPYSPEVVEWMETWMPPWEPARFATLVEDTCPIPVS